MALLFGVFKCRSFAEVLFGLSETDAQLELQEKHYDKIKRKSMYWIVFLALLLAGHAVAMYQILQDSVGFDILILLSDTMAHSTLFVLDLQYLYMIMVLCKRYRLCNKILVHITKVNLASGYRWRIKMLNLGYTVCLKIFAVFFKENCTELRR